MDVPENLRKQVIPRKGENNGSGAPTSKIIYSVSFNEHDGSI